MRPLPDVPKTQCLQRAKPANMYRVLYYMDGIAESDVHFRYPTTMGHVYFLFQDLRNLFVLLAGPLHYWLTCDAK